MLKGIIFDLDGVLIDSMSYHIISWKKAFDNVNLKTTTKEIALCEGMNYKETIDLFSKKNNLKFTIKEKEQVHDEKKKLLKEIFKIKMYPGIISFLEKIKKNDFKIFIVTGSNTEFATSINSKYFNNIFDGLISSNDIKKGKPNPESYLKVVEKSKLKKEELIVIENAPLGIKSAKSAGLKTIALQTTLAKKYLLEADIIFKNHKELYDYFKKKYFI